MLLYLSIILAVLSSMLYHVILKFTPPTVNPALSLAVTYGVSLALCLALLPLFPLEGPVGKALGELNWASYALAAALVGLEVGFLLAYRAGWQVSTAALIVNVAATVLLVPVGIAAFEESLSPLNVTGIVFCLAGLVMVNVRT